MINFSFVDDSRMDAQCLLALFRFSPFGAAEQIAFRRRNGSGLLEG